MSAGGGAAGLTLPDVLALILVVALNGYVLLGGADFGGGVWDLLASGRRKAEQRQLITDAIGPIWEANHVWLVVVVVVLFTCFPPAFAELAITLHIPLVLMLIGIVLRGSAFTFRSYGGDRSATQRRWGRAFAGASVATPVLLGICLGAITAERVPAGSAGSFAARFVGPWLAPFPFAVGVLALALFAFLAAVYLTVEAPSGPLAEDFRARALGAAAAVFVAAFGVLVLARAGAAPRVGRALISSHWALPLHLVTGVAAVTAIWALWVRRYRVARLAAAAQVSCILWGWAVARFPYLIPPRLTIAQAAAPHRVLVLMLWALGIGAAVLFPSLAYLFRVFKGAGHGAFRRVDEAR